MKYFVILLFSLCIGNVYAGDNVSKAVSSKSIVFFGIDYTYLKLIHKVDFVDKLGVTDCNALLERYCQEWNEIFLTENEKFDLKKYLDVDKVTIDLTKSNAKIATLSMADCTIEDDKYQVSTDKLKELVSNYADNKSSGVGVIIVAESLNKSQSKGNFHLVYFDISSGEFLTSFLMNANPSGFGFSNYWVNSLWGGLIAVTKDIKKARSAK